MLVFMVFLLRAVANAFDMMWKITVVDIQTTLDEVTQYILQGRDMPDEYVQAEIEFDLAVDQASSIAEGDRASSSASRPSVTQTASCDGSPHSDSLSSGARRTSSSAVSQRNKIPSPSSLVSKLTLENLEKGLERFLLPKREHREGKAVRKKSDVLHARATGLKRLGKVFVSVGRGEPTSLDTGASRKSGETSEGPCGGDVADVGDDSLKSTGGDSRFDGDTSRGLALGIHSPVGSPPTPLHHSRAPPRQPDALVS
jgi:hypothetical protein